MSASAPKNRTKRATPSVDRLLRFDHKTAAIYEVEYGAERARKLAQMILIGLIFYNLYNFTSIALLPDILLLSVFLRLGVVTPSSIALAWLVLRVPARTRELSLLMGMMSAALIPIGLFWLSVSPYSTYTFMELPLSLFFGLTVLAIRFHHALVFALIVGVIVTAALTTKAGLDPNLQVALLLQFLTACFFGLTANYVIERRRCMAFVKTLTARQMAMDAMQETAALRKLSLTDPLTKLANRRHFEEVGETWLAEGRSVALLMIDIDFFKSFNDTKGHVAGDECLAQVARAIGSFERKDRLLAARLGGEEFALLVSDVSELELSDIGNDMLRRVHALGIEHLGRPDGLGIVTVSIGGAMGRSGSDRRLVDLLKASDEALYEVKAEGRNGFLLPSGQRAVA